MAYSNPVDDSKPAKLSKKDESETLELLEDYFEIALDDPSWSEHRDDAVRCFDYKENRQWTKAELSELAARGQPPVIDNQCKVTIDRIVGQFVQVKTKTVYKPRNGKLDDAVATGMSDIYAYIRQTSKLAFEERDVLEDGVTGGFGCFEVCVEEDPDGDPRGDDVKVKHVDCFEVYPDPRSKRYDWNEDARFICRAKWVDAEYLKHLYPTKKRKIEGLFNDSGNIQLSNVDTLRGETYLDHKRERVRLVECEYKKSVTDDETGDREERIYVGVFTGGVLFEHGKSKRKRYKFVPYFVNRKKNGSPYGSIFIALPLQDSLNKRKSKALALLTMNQATYEKGAIADKDVLRIEMTRPDGMIEIEEGFSEKFKIDKNLELAQSQNAMYLQDLQAFRQVTGVNPDALGEKSEIRSGVGIQRKVAMTGLVIAPTFDNFMRTRDALAQTIHDAVAIAYTSEKVLTITDNPRVTREVILSNESLDAIKQTKYDVIISEEQDYDTVQEQQLDIISKSLPSILQFGPGWAEVLLEMSSIRDKDSILEKVRQVSAQAAPKPQPSMNFSAQLDKLTLPEKIFIYQKLEMPPELIEAMLKENLPPTQVIQMEAAERQSQVDAQAEAGKAQQAGQSEALKAQTEQQKAETAKVKGQVDIQKAGIDMQVKQMEAGFKERELEQKQQAQRENTALSMAAQMADVEGKQKMQAQKAKQGGSNGKTRG